MTRSKVQGRGYLERGRPVEVLARWGPGGGPRNVLIRRETGELVVRPFRGLRRNDECRDGGQSYWQASTTERP